ncbi:MAG: PDZ domain-containing protein [Candidatus Dormibacteria bacterium]
MSEKKKGLFGRMFSANGTSDEPSPEEVQRWLGQTGRRPGYGPGPSGSQPSSQQPTAFQGGSPASSGPSGAQRRAFSDLASGFAGGSSAPTAPGPGWSPPGYSNTTDEDDDDEGIGVEIANVGPTGPLADAGLREGDIIVAVDGDVVGDEADLAAALGSLAPGRSATLEIVRGNSRITAVVVAPG